jgi:arsenate reductase (thioredoxin)
MIEGGVMRRKIFERNILFLCEDNECRSQMAEAMAKYLNPPNTRVVSAGVEPREIPPPVHDVMAEFGISLSGQTPKGLTAVPLDEIDLVISFGDIASRCDSLPRKAKVEYWSIPDPYAQSENGSVPFASLRLCRDAIDKYVAALLLDHWRNVA